MRRAPSTVRLGECFCGCRQAGRWGGREVGDIFSPLVKALYCPSFIFSFFIPISAYRNQKKWESLRVCRGGGGSSGGGGGERVQTKPLAFLISRLALLSSCRRGRDERMPPAGSLRRHLINIKRRPWYPSVIIVVYLFYIPLVVFTAARTAAPAMRR